MIFNLKELLVWLTLCTLGQICSSQLYITGNEEPLIIGLSRDIICTWNGDSNATTMEWFLVGLDAVPIESESNSNRVVLSPDPNSNGLDGAMFTCKATLANGTQIEETIVLDVRALENIVNITASTSVPFAGDFFTLTCIVISERVPLVTWMDPNGDPCPVDGSDMTVSPAETVGLYTYVSLTFTSIRTSNSGTYKCLSNIVNPPSKNELSYSVIIQIPQPIVTVSRYPDHPVQLYTTNNLTLTCTIELISEVDSPIIVNARWSGHTSLTDSERRVIVSELKGTRLLYRSQVTFSTLKSVDSGSYVCSASVSPQENNSSNLIFESWLASDSLNISVVLNVSIRVTYNSPSDFDYPSPPYYRPATTLTLTCIAHEASGSVTYRWSSTNSNSFTSGGTSQSMTKNMLTSNDVGIHTCTPTDSSRNTGSGSTEIKLIGIGIFVVQSDYQDNTAVTNNSVIMRESSSCERCSINIYCYSNTTSSSVGYIIFPNSGRVYSDSSYYRMSVYRTSPSGINMYNRYWYYPDSYGIYTCELPDSEGNTLEASIGIYEYTPSAPEIYDISYTNMLSTFDNILGRVEFKTRYSPPTTVTLLRDGAPVTVDGYNYEITHDVTNRYYQNSYYNNRLYIRNAADLAGYHTYQFTVTNYAGSDIESISTSFTVIPDARISYEVPVKSKPFILTCESSLHRKVAPQLIDFVVLEWVGPDGVILSDGDNITLEEQLTFYDTTYRSLIFNPLSMSHGGDYSCEAKLLLPGSSDSFNSNASYHLNVLDVTLIQLKFGPIIHCTKWFEDQRIAHHLEHDIKNTLTDIVNANCGCGFHTSLIDRGEFTCQTLSKTVIYRARIAGSSDTLLLHQVLSSIRDWMTNDGTFLSTYHGRIRLRVDPNCPLEISSFSDPEYDGGLFLTSQIQPPDEL